MSPASALIFYRAWPELMRPQVMHMSPDKLVLLRPGTAPTLASKIRYYADPEFRGPFDA
jgi:type IV secretory pathway TraG/TraD family ATPase VirD4